MPQVASARFTNVAKTLKLPYAVDVAVGSFLLNSSLIVPLMFR